MHSSLKRTTGKRTTGKKTTVKKHKGQASSLFIIICTSLVCLAIFFVYQFGTFKAKQNSIEQAEFEQTHGKPAGSSPDYKKLQAAIQTERNDREMAQKELKSDWLERLNPIIEAQNLPQIEENITELKQSTLIQEYQIQLLQQWVTQAVKNHNLDVLNTLLATGAPLVRCDIHLREGNKLLKHALENQDIKSFVTLVQAGCMKGRSTEKTELITHILTSPEPWKSDLFKALDSNKALQTTVLKNMLDEGQETKVVEYLSKGLISKDSALGSSTLLSYSILNNLSQLSQQLIQMGAKPAGKSSVYDHAFVVALKQQNLSLFKQLASTYPEDLKDTDLIRTVFSTSNDESLLQVTEILFENNPDVIENKYVSNHLLRNAVTEGHYEQVKFLLENGLSPNTFMGRKTLLGLASENQTEGSQEMVNLLREHGAIEDLLELVRQERGITKNTPCDYAERPTVEPKVFTTAYDLITNNPNKDYKTSDWSQVQVCEASIVYCKDQGFGVDACMTSVPSCSGNGTQACCAGEIKTNYFAGRCAGLGVRETIYWMDVFSTVYGVPANFSD